MKIINLNSKSYDFMFNNTRVKADIFEWQRKIKFIKKQDNIYKIYKIYVEFFIFTKFICKFILADD